jgi:cytochrome c biogenesis protein CcmG, thiol:disulfide interchange protein DsbE
MESTPPTKIARSLLMLLLATILLAGTTNCSSTTQSKTPASTPSQTPRMLHVDDTAPDFTLDTLDGTRTLHLSDFSGKIVLLSFWEINCLPCVKQLPIIQKFYAQQQSAGKPFAILSVNIDQVSKFVAVATLQQHLALTFPILVDDHYQARNRYPFTKVPISYFIDSHRFIRSILAKPLDESTLHTTLSSIEK